MSDMTAFFETFLLILIWILIIYCMIGIIMYIGTSKKKKARDIMLIQTICLILITIFFIKGFGVEEEILGTFECIKIGIMNIFR